MAKNIHHLRRRVILGSDRSLALSSLRAPACRVLLISTIVVLATIFLSEAKAETKTYPLSSLQGLKLRNVSAEPVTYEGRKAMRVVEPSGQKEQATGESLVIIEGTDFQNGVIEVEVAGKPAAGAFEGARGFVGVAFRVAPDASKFECIYLRPTNGRADDQERRNHSTQYFSFPEYPWFRLRKEAPGRYESYVDLEPAVWTKVKIEVAGIKARLYVHGAEQPALVVNDLKLGISKGAIGLMIGPGTVAHFTNLSVSQERAGDSSPR